MKDLLSKVETLLKEEERKNEEKINKRRYRPKQSTLDKISKEKPEIEHYFHGQVASIVNFGKTERVDELFKEVTKMDSSKVTLMDLPTKEKVIHEIKRFFKEHTLSTNYFYYYFNGAKYKPVEERLKMVTSGKDTRGITFVSKEEKEKLHGIVKNINYLLLEEFIFDVNKREEISFLVVDYILFFSKSSSLVPRFFSKNLIESFLLNENSSRILEKIKTVFVKEKIDIFTPFYKQNYGADDVDNYMYLFSTDERKMLKKEYELRLENEYENLMKEKSKSLYLVRRIHNDIKLVNQWI